MVEERQNPATSHENGDPTSDLAIPSREQQWLDVVSYPAAPLPPRVEPMQTLVLPEVVFPTPLPSPTTESTEWSETGTGAIRCIAIILLTVFFLFAWQERAGEESTVNRTTASSILNK